MQGTSTLFARLFGMSMVAIVLAHVVAYFWFQKYGMGPPHSPMLDDSGRLITPPPPNTPPMAFLVIQFISIIAVAWWGARLLSRPIRQFSEAAERLSENLDSPPLEETGPRESRQAAHIFNRMQQRIREQVRQRSQMLGAVSHDLRTPLSRMKLRIEQIDDQKLQGQMRQDLDDMISMLDATLSYLHEQRTSEAVQLYDVQALVESLCENAQDHGDDISTRGHCRPLLIQPIALRSCLSNLIDNALRYGGATLVDLRDSPTQVTVRIIDHGPGIEASLRETVFEAFYRVEGSRNRNSGGVGLGLTLARDAVTRMGGSITLEETPGGGLTAMVTLMRR